MKATCIFLLLILSVNFAGAQIKPEEFIKKIPAIPKDSCGITRAAAESFTQNVTNQFELIVTEIERLNEVVNQKSEGSKETAKANAMKQMSQQYGLSPEDMAKMQSGKMSAAEKQAIANKVLQQQTNMSVGEVQNISKMSDAGKKAYTEAYATEMMATSMANPNQEPVNDKAKNMQQLLAAQQAALGKITANSQKIGNLYAAIQNDPAGKEMLKNIDIWHNKLMSMTGIDYGQGKQMDSLSVLIVNEQNKYCHKFTPKYRSALRQHLSLIKASLPDYRKVGELTAEVTKAQTGITIPPENAEIMGLQAVKDYVNALGNVFKFNLRYPEDQ